ncbi:formate dehydrogenase [Beijerinckiaceae bacterium]|nr:formate dehydrogenase [Beijerinckiaceae bacterium]
MSHETSPKKLVYMANQIGKFFAPQEHGKAVAGIANHISHFWAPAMRKKIYDHLTHGGEGLDPLAKEALEKLRREEANPAEYSA